jgi:hypothetical protein
MLVHELKFNKSLKSHLELLENNINHILGSYLIVQAIELRWFFYMLSES